MGKRLSELLQRAGYIIKTDGIIGLVRRSYTYFSPMIFDYGQLYLYQTHLKEWEEVNFKSKLGNVACKIIKSNQEADSLKGEYEDFRDIFMNASDYLNRGGIAVCLYSDREFASISWLAITQAARDCADSLPYRVDFSHGKACTGGTFTVPKFRGNNLMTYSNYKKFRYLKELGKTSVLNAIRTDNVASQKVYSKFGALMYARATYIRIFGFKYWREIPSELESL